MPGTPKWKIFDSHNNYQAACKEIEAAAALIGFYGEGATIRSGHATKDTVWSEGNEAQEAHVSFDYVANVAATRELRRNARSLKKIYGEAWVHKELKQLGYDDEVIAEALAA